MSTLKNHRATPPETGTTTPRTLVERAYLSLRHDVVCGKLAPGERLRVEHLKDQYEVGAGTLREALSLLVSDALVTSEGQRGFRVAPISLADLEDVTNTRVMLETEALRQSIRRGDAQWEAALVASYRLLTEVWRHCALIQVRRRPATAPPQPSAASRAAMASAIGAPVAAS